MRANNYNYCTLYVQYEYSVAVLQNITGELQFLIKRDLLVSTLVLEYKYSKRERTITDLRTRPSYKRYNDVVLSILNIVQNDSKKYEQNDSFPRPFTSDGLRQLCPLLVSCILGHKSVHLSFISKKATLSSDRSFVELRIGNCTGDYD